MTQFRVSFNDRAGMRRARHECKVIAARSPRTCHAYSRGDPHTGAAIYGVMYNSSAWTGRPRIRESIILRAWATKAAWWVFFSVWKRVCDGRHAFSLYDRFCTKCHMSTEAWYEFQHKPFWYGLCHLPYGVAI